MCGVQGSEIQDRQDRALGSPNGFTARVSGNKQIQQEHNQMFLNTLRNSQNPFCTDTNWDDIQFFAGLSREQSNSQYGFLGLKMFS